MMSLNKRPSSSVGVAGFTILEVLITLGLLGIVFVGVQSAVNQYLDQSQQAKSSTSNDQIVESVLKRVIADVNQFQVDFGVVNTTPVNGKCTNSEPLPVAWDVEVYTAEKNCPRCPGRLGYWVQPLENYRGLYKVTVRVTHTKIYPEGHCQDYTFIVGNR